MNDFELLKRLLITNRSTRRFEQDKPIEREVLMSLVNLTRYCASARNIQPLRYRIIDDVELCNAVFPLLAWAGYLKDWAGPEPGERPVSYLIQCLDTHYGNNCLCDDGLHLQTITLGARALGISCCIIKAFNAPKLKSLLGLPEEMEPRYVLALGYPAETIVLEDSDGTKDADIKYYRTEDGVHHVPKRPLEELLI